MIKNKLYSVMDEEGNLGYYLYNESTGEEKLFSVVEEEQREFADNSEDDVKLKPLHRYNVAMYKLEGKLGRKLDRQHIEGDWKSSAKRGAAVAGISTLIGTGIGAAVGGKYGAKAGAKVGAALGTGAAVGGTLGTAAVKKLRKSSSRYDKAARQRLDEIALAEGKMTKKDYVNKWYKQKN